MAEACYTARATTKQQVLDGVNKLTLQTNEHGQYMHDAILLLQKGIRCVLNSQFNPSDPGKGMEKLLNDGDNLLTLVKSTDAITTSYVIKEAKKRADKLTASTGKTVSPSITAQAEAQEEADQLNVINQLGIGTKEGVVKAITKLDGSNVTNAILRMANVSDHKSIDDFTLFEMMKSAIDCANQPSTNNVLEQLLKVINHNFNFGKKVSTNMELMQSNVAQIVTYGIAIGIPQLTLTLLANINTATKSNYGHEFCLAMPAIFKKYTYNHMHDATLLQFILKELVGANGICILKDAPAPGTGTTHLVAKSVSYLQVMMGEDTVSTHIESAYSVSSDSNSSEEERKPRARKRKKSQLSKSCSGSGKKKKDKDDKPKKNMCPHCKKFHRTKPHRVKLDKGMWNKKYKNYCFKLICNDLKVAFKPCYKFAAKLGGYASKDKVSGDMIDGARGHRRTERMMTNGLR
jgi:hypothetical protein